MLHQLTRFPRRRLGESIGRFALPLVVAIAVALVAGLGGDWGTALGETAPNLPPSGPSEQPPPPPGPPPPAGPPAPAPGNIQFSGPPSNVDVPPGGGTINTPLSYVDATLPGTGGSNTISFTPVNSGSLSDSLGSDYQNAGLQFGDGALLIEGLVGGVGMTQPVAPGYYQAAAVQMVPLGQRAFVVPVVLTYRPTQGDLEKTGGDVSRIVLSLWTGKAWLGLPNSVDAANNRITVTVARSGLVATLIRPADPKAVETDLPNGRFYSATNGFGGAGGTGYTVTDDDQAAFWTEFRRMGGTQRVGYPISGRFVHGGFTTQAFQKMVLQWRPDVARSVPVNVFDDLNTRGVDGWLDIFRQVPPAADTSADAGLAWEDVVARHLSFLDPYPALRVAYLNDPNWVESYGLPLAVKEYGPLVDVRLQRGTLQLWKVNVPWAAAGSVVVGNGGDLAKEAGLWPVEALVPGALR